MSHSLESVMQKLGDDAQLVGGRVIVFRDGKHTDVGGLGLHDGVFSLTSDGLLLLDEGTVIDQAPAETETEKPKETKQTKGKADKAPAADGAEGSLGDNLDLVG